MKIGSINHYDAFNLNSVISIKRFKIMYFDCPRSFGVTFWKNSSTKNIGLYLGKKSILLRVIKSS